MDELEKLRREIDAVDAEIVRAFEERIRIAEQVAECKIEKGLPVLDRKREDVYKRQTWNCTTAFCVSVPK